MSFVGVPCKIFNAKPKNFIIRVLEGHATFGLGLVMDIPF
jgi:hypothetical protein